MGRSYTIKSWDDQHRIARLLGLRLSGKPEIRQAQLDKSLPIGTTSDIGFSPAGGYKPPHIPRDLSSLTVTPTRGTQLTHYTGGSITQEDIDHKKGRRRKRKS